MTRVLYIGALGIAAIALSAALDPTPRLVWNASASVPIGLYRVRSLGTPGIGDLVLVAPPEALARLLASRGYLAAGLPILKHIAALPGQTVCRTGDIVTVDGQARATALRRDHAGRPLPVWLGCRLLRPDQVFLLNPDAPASFDGRYVGPMPRPALRGRAIPIWTGDDR